LKTANGYIQEIKPKLANLTDNQKGKILTLLLEYFDEESKKVSSKSEYDELYSAFDTVKREIYINLGWN
jgi:hypothetical protein